MCFVLPYLHFSYRHFLIWLCRSRISAAADTLIEKKSIVYFLYHITAGSWIGLIFKAQRFIFAYFDLLWENLDICQKEILAGLIWSPCFFFIFMPWILINLHCTGVVHGLRTCRHFLTIKYNVLLVWKGMKIKEWTLWLHFIWKKFGLPVGLFLPLLGRTSSHNI